MSILSDRLRELRGAQSQKEMADAVGIKYQAWARYEKGEVSPGAEILTQICRVHTVSADWLLGLSEDNSRKSSAAEELLDNSPEKAADGDNSSLKVAAATFKNNSPEKAVESGVKTISAGALNAAEKGVDCATCKYRLFAEAFKALQPPA